VPPLAACSRQLGIQQLVGPEANTLVTGAIQTRPEKLQRQYDKLTQLLQKELGVKVIYKPHNDYTAAVTAFKVGGLRPSLVLGIDVRLWLQAEVQKRSLSET